MISACIACGLGKKRLSHVMYFLESVCSMSSHKTSYGMLCSSKPLSTFCTSFSSWKPQKKTNSEYTSQVLSKVCKLATVLSFSLTFPLSSSHFFGRAYLVIPSALVISNREKGRKFRTTRNFGVLIHYILWKASR